MKKIFTILSAAALLCACNKNVQPQAGYGYIDLGVSADESMGTKAVSAVDDLSGWTVLVGSTAYTGATMPIAAGTYTVSAKNFASMEAANTGRGAAFYSGETAGVVVTAGSTATPTIACGQAKNARFKVVFDTSFTSMTGISSYQFVTTDTRAVTFNNTLTDPAYYAPEASVSYSITYNFGSTPKSITGSITLGAAATEKTITVKGNSNGTITISVTIDGTFTDVGNTDITIDANTGEQA